MSYVKFTEVATERVERASSFALAMRIHLYQDSARRTFEPSLPPAGTDENSGYRCSVVIPSSWGSVQRQDGSVGDKNRRERRSRADSGERTQSNGRRHRPGTWDGTGCKRSIGEPRISPSLSDVHVRLKRIPAASPMHNSGDVTRYR